MNIQGIASFFIGALRFMFSYKNIIYKILVKFNEIMDFMKNKNIKEFKEYKYKI